MNYEKQKHEFKKGTLSANKSQVLQGKVTWRRSDTEVATVREISLPLKLGRGRGVECGAKGRPSRSRKRRADLERHDLGDAGDILKTKAPERPHSEETKSLLPAREPAIHRLHPAGGTRDRKNGRCPVDSRKPLPINPAPIRDPS